MRDTILLATGLALITIAAMLVIKVVYMLL